MMQIKDYKRDVNNIGLAGPLLKIPGSATDLMLLSSLRKPAARPG
jgi:hypothetical protein